MNDDSSTPGSNVRLITSRASQNRLAKAIRFIAPEIALRLLSVTSLTVPARDSLSSSSLPFLAFRHTAKILFCNLFLSNARRWMVEKLISFLFQFEFFFEFDKFSSYCILSNSFFTAEFSASSDFHRTHCCAHFPTSLNDNILQLCICYLLLCALQW